MEQIAGKWRDSGDLGSTAVTISGGENALI
jgi:hypothetical protein